MKTSKWYYKKALDETQRLVSEIEQIVESYQCDSRKTYTAPLTYVKGAVQYMKGVT